MTAVTKRMAISFAITFLAIVAVGLISEAEGWRMVAIGVLMGAFSGWHFYDGVTRRALDQGDL